MLPPLRKPWDSVGGEWLCANDMGPPLDEARISGPGAGGMVAPSKRAGSDGYGWLVAEPNAHYDVGMQITDLQSLVAVGGRALVGIEGGAPLLVERVLLTELDEFLSRVRDRFHAPVPTSDKIGAEVEVVPMDDGDLVDGRSLGAAESGGGA